MKFDQVKFLAAVKAMKESVFGTEKFMDYKLKDGVTIIRYEADKLDIGVPVMAVTEEGAIAMPDGDYELEDGTKFSIAGGLVSAVTPMDAPAEEGDKVPAAQSQTPKPPAAMTEAGAKAIVESIIKETRFAEEIAELKTQIAEFKTVKENFATQKEANEKEVADLKTELEANKTTLKELFALVETIAGEDSAKPAEKKREVFSVAEFKKNYRADLQKLSEQI